MTSVMLVLVVCIPIITGGLAFREIAHLRAALSDAQATAAQATANRWWEVKVRELDAQFPDGWGMACSAGDPGRQCDAWGEGRRVW